MAVDTQERIENLEEAALRPEIEEPEDILSVDEVRYELLTGKLKDVGFLANCVHYFRDHEDTQRREEGFKKLKEIAKGIGHVYLVEYVQLEEELLDTSEEERMEALSCYAQKGKFNGVSQGEKLTTLQNAIRDGRGRLEEVYEPLKSEFNQSSLGVLYRELFLDSWLDGKIVPYLPGREGVQGRVNDLEKTLSEEENESKVNGLLRELEKYNVLNQLTKESFKEGIKRAILEAESVEDADANLVDFYSSFLRELEDLAFEEGLMVGSEIDLGEVVKALDSERSALGGDDQEELDYLINGYVGALQNDNFYCEYKCDLTKWVEGALSGEQRKDVVKGLAQNHFLTGKLVSLAKDYEAEEELIEVMEEGLPSVSDIESTYKRSALEIYGNRLRNVINAACNFGLIIGEEIGAKVETFCDKVGNEELKILLYEQCSEALDNPYLGNDYKKSLVEWVSYNEGDLDG